MKRRFILPLMVTLLALAGVSCASDTSPTKAAPTTPPATASPSPAIERQTEDFDPRAFKNPTRVDNKWFPLVPGTQRVYEGATTEDGERVPHRVVFTVTDLTKVIGGVRTVVIYEEDYSDGQLVEAEVAFLAEDDGGTVWRLGEYPEEYEEGKFVKAPAWIAGIQGAKPGITMKPEPKLGTPSYSQGWGPAVGWNDRGKVSKVGLSACVRAGCYDDVLVIEEFSIDEPGAFQLKYFAPGLGNVKVGWSGKDETQETLELVRIVRLDSTALASVRKKALALDDSGYKRSKSVYALTLRIERREG